MSETETALISVYDKTGIVEFTGELQELGFNIYASGGTFTTISEGGVPSRNVAELTGSEAILRHRVVTLSEVVAAGLLADPNNKEDMADMRQKKWPIIHLVCRDSYPLEQEIANPDATPESVLEQTDIGGPTMLSEAAKGRRIVLSVPEQRQQVLEWLRAGRPNAEEFIDQLAARAVYEFVRYNMIRAKYLNGIKMSGHIALKLTPTKYGENPQQEDAAVYADSRVNIDPLGVDQFRHIQGMEHSYVNETDIDRLRVTATHIAAGFERNFGEVPPMAIGVKHGNACGAAVGENLVEAVKKMIEGDTRAIFGGVVMVNGLVDEEVAETLMRYEMSEDAKDRFLDGVVAADFTEEALKILKREKLRAVANPALANLSEDSLDKSRLTRQLRGGNLEQPNHTFVIDLSADYIQHYGQASDQQKRDMVLAWAIGCRSNSNTITLVKNGKILGNGVGQQDRVGAGQLALTRTTIELPELEEDGGELVMTVRLDKRKIEGAVAYSDSFFPFTDGPELLAKAGIKAILTSSGSQADKDVIAALREYGVNISMVPDKVGRGFSNH